MNYSLHPHRAWPFRSDLKNPFTHVLQLGDEAGQWPLLPVHSSLEDMVDGLAVIVGPVPEVTYPWNLFLTFKIHLKNRRNSPFKVFVVFIRRLLPELCCFGQSVVENCRLVRFGDPLSTKDRLLNFMAILPTYSNSVL